jgi:hypothetical protein
MPAANIELSAVVNAIDEFKVILEPGIRSQIGLTDVYRVRQSRSGAAHWPANWEDAWGHLVKSGIYLHFNEDDALLYVGKAVSVPARLAAYYAYADRHRDKSCRVLHEGLAAAGGCGVRAIGLTDKLRFLGPSLEWFLIHHLNPPLNTQGRNWEPTDS